MAKTIEISDELHEALAARAVGAGLSLPEYLARELDALAEHESAMAELLQRIRGREPVDLGIAAADLIRESREERDREINDRWSSSTPRR